MSQYFPPYRSFENNIKVELYLSSYATKSDLKDVTHVDARSFTSKTNLASLKTEVDKINADKLATAPNLAKPSNVVKNDVVKKLNVASNIGATGFFLETTFDTDKSDLEKKISDTDKKIPDTSDLAKKKI